MLAQLQRTAPDADVSQRLRTLDAQLVETEMAPVDLRFTGSGRDGVRFGSKLISKIGYLTNEVATADFRPTVQEVEAPAILATDLGAALLAIDGMLARELPRVKVVHVAKGLPRIIDLGGVPARLVP